MSTEPVASSSRPSGSPERKNKYLHVFPKDRKNEGSTSAKFSHFIQKKYGKTLQDDYLCKILNLMIFLNLLIFVFGYIASEQKIRKKI